MKRALQSILVAGESMRDDTKNGKKKITIREGHRDYTEGPVLIGCPTLDWAYSSEITSVLLTTLGKVAEQDLNDDGFDSTEDAIEVLSQWYPSINKDSPVTVIRWK